MYDVIAAIKWKFQFPSVWLYLGKTNVMLVYNLHASWIDATDNIVQYSTVIYLFYWNDVRLKANVMYANFACSWKRMLANMYERTNERTDEKNWIVTGNSRGSSWKSVNIQSKFAFKSTTNVWKAENKCRARKFTRWGFSEEKDRHTRREKEADIWKKRSIFRAEDNRKMKA